MQMQASGGDGWGHIGHVGEVKNRYRILV